MTPAPSIRVGSAVAAGGLLGTQVGDETMTGVAVEEHRAGGVRLVSFFDTLADSTFASLVARGVASRDAVIISLEERDAAPLSCDGEPFVGEDSLPAWTDLAP